MSDKVAVMVEITKCPPGNRRMTDIERSNSLTDLAQRIREWDRTVKRLLQHSVCYAMNAGDLLIEAKQHPQLKHGQWLPWLKHCCSLTERTAQRYMRLARNRATIEAKYDTVSDLSINGALALLTDVNAVAAVEAAEAVQDKAEEARREVLIDASERNLEVITALKEKWVPGDYHSGPWSDPVPATAPVRWSDPDLEKEWNEMAEDVQATAEEYDLAIECGDHARAFELLSWLHDFSAWCRSFCEDMVRRAELAGAKPQTGK
jgi:hypothetical protein